MVPKIFEQICSKFKLVILALLIMYGQDIFAQYSQDNSYWKLERHSVNFSIGAINFLGELGGRDQIGTQFINDLETSQTRPTLHVNYKYNLFRTISAKVGLTYGILSGNDNLTKETFRMNRNIHFRSHIVELSAFADFDIVTFGNPKAQFVQKQVSVLYGFIGIGGLYFNPQGKFRGEWHALQPLGTEGQNQPDGPPKYKKITAVIPVGIGYRWSLTSEWSIGVEIAFRKTFSDYLDDTSTDYYDNQVIRETQGELAAYFADPSLGFRIDDDGNMQPLNSTFTGAQRGNPDDMDAFLMASFNAQYKILKKRFKKGRSRLHRNRTKRALF